MADGQDMTGLMRQCLALPFDDRCVLATAIQNSIQEDLMKGRNPADRYEFLKARMEDVLGEPIPIRNRSSRFAWARTVIAYQMVSEGMTEEMTGHLMGRNHSTINYYRNKMVDAFGLPHQYRDVIELWNEFQKRISDETER